MRNENISKLRVIAIIFVVLGHAMIIYDPSWNIFTTERTSNFFFYFKQFINILQMPIFMMVSGYLFYYSLKKEKYMYLRDLVIEKFKRLIIPFLFISFFWIVPIRLLVDYQPFVQVGYFKSVFYVLIGKDSGHAWFLPTLFGVFIFIYILNKYIKFNHLLMLLLLIGFHFISYTFSGLFFINDILRYLVFFDVGFIFASMDINLEFNSKFYLNVFIFIITSFSSVFYYENPIIVASLNLVSAITGTYVIYNCCTLIRGNKIFKFLDKQSFAIYLFHSPVMYIIYNNFANLNPVLLVTLNIGTSVLVSLSIAIILRRMNLSFLLGEEKLIVRE